MFSMEDVDNPDCCYCVVNVVDPEDNAMRSPVAQMISRAAVATVKNPSIHDDRRIARRYAVDSHLWSVCFYAGKVGLYDLTVTQAEQVVGGAPAIVEVSAIETGGGGVAWLSVSLRRDA